MSLASVPTRQINGQLTLGENIADNGGFRLAYRAYRNEVARWERDEELRVPGKRTATPDQLFFLANAQAWCQQITPQVELLLLLSAPHSPAVFR